MNADSVAKSFLCPWVNATADSATGGYPAEALALAHRSVSVPMGVGGYVMEVPRALPVGLHIEFTKPNFGKQWRLHLGMAEGKVVNATRIMSVGIRPDDHVMLIVEEGNVWR
ncbi:MAG: hypothetical protein A2170_01280 [Deltaproteobacteria bacterium RBG_13_53_10]|nr:MAG: hypothetical protein A2170_01280 [Deltaproteobacteria bacterium RBG_13_53_10]